MRKKIFLAAFIVLTLVNILIFIFREQFAYQPYADYSTLYQPCYDCIEVWKQAVNDYPTTEMAAAKKITDSITNENHTTLNKVFSIGKFLYDRFKNRIGTPTETLGQSSPLSQYTKLCSSASEKLWCGNFAAMFSFFAWSKGITTRTIEIMYAGDHHVLNECYIPEIKKWVMVDITNNIILTKDDSSFLDLISFKNAAIQKKNLFVLQAKSEFLQERLTVIPHQYLSSAPMYYYHRTDNQKVYTTLNKLKRYFLPVSWYDIFDDKKHSNLAFYLKEVFSFLWLISLSAFVVSRLKFKS